jgi:hypothetical protein
MRDAMGDKESEENRQSGTWTPEMLKQVRDMLVYGVSGISFALTGRTTYATFGEEKTVSQDYRGFLPHKGLDRVPFHIRELHPEEEAPDQPTDIGYLNFGPVLSPGQKEPGPWINASIRKETGILDALEKAFIESRTFRSKAELELNLERLRDHVTPEELLGKRMAIRSVTIDSGSSCGGEWFKTRAESRSFRDKLLLPLSLRTKMRYGWSVFLRILVLVLAFRIFALASTPFEAALLAVLALIFIDSRYVSNAGLQGLRMDVLRQSLYLGRLLHDPELERKEWKGWRWEWRPEGDDSPMDFEEPDAVTQYAEAQKKLDIAAQIDSGFIVILFIMASWNIVNSIFHFI